MKKMVLCAWCMVLGAVAAHATPFWAELTTKGWPDGKGGFEASGYIDRYAAYLCTADAAKTFFGGNDTAGGVSDWLSGDGWTHYNAGMAALTGGAIQMDPYGFDDGEYSFMKYFQDALEGNYLAVVTYADGKDAWFRVFENTAAADGNLTLDAVAAPAIAGAWVQVPEPTSGLLLLLGVAGLVLKRKLNG